MCISPFWQQMHSWLLRTPIKVESISHERCSFLTAEAGVMCAQCRQTASPRPARPVCAEARHGTPRSSPAPGGCMRTRYTLLLFTITNLAKLHLPHVLYSFLITAENHLHLDLPLLHILCRCSCPPFPSCPKLRSCHCLDDRNDEIDANGGC